MVVSFFFASFFLEGGGCMLCIPVTSFRCFFISIFIFSYFIFYFFRKRTVCEGIVRFSSKSHVRLDYT